MDRITLLEARVRRAERNNRLFGALFLLTITALLIGFKMPPADLEGTSLKILKEGKVVAMINADGLCLFDAQTNPRMLLNLNDGNPSFSLLDAKSEPRGVFALNKGEPVLATFDGKGDLRIGMSQEGSQAAVTVFSPGGKDGIVIAVNDEGSLIVLDDSAGTARVGFSAKKGPDSGMFISDEKGRPRISMQMSGLIPQITLLDEAGKVVKEIAP